MTGSVPPPLPGVGPFQRLPSIDETRWVVLAVRNKPYWKAGTLDPVLTNACRRGEFATATFNRMVVRFTDPSGAGALQVVVPTHRHLLFDQRNLAKPNETYFFFSSAQPDCQVWIEGKVKPRILPPSGSIVPKQDPQALKKRKAVIDSWPQPPPYNPPSQ